MKYILHILSAVICFSNVMRSQEVIKVKKQKDSLFTIVDKSAEFPGGAQGIVLFINRNISFPKVCLEDSTFNGRCTVFIKFIIDEVGKVDNIQILKGCKCEAFNKEAIRVVSIMPLWTPGIVANKPVKTYFQYPIRFQIQ